MTVLVDLASTVFATALAYGTIALLHAATKRRTR